MTSNVVNLEVWKNPDPSDTMIRIWSPYGLLAGDSFTGNDNLDAGVNVKEGDSFNILRVMSILEAHRFLSYLEARMIVDPAEFSVEMPTNPEGSEWNTVVSGSKALDILDSWFGVIV